jgi:hypothetical protein
MTDDYLLDLVALVPGKDEEETLDELFKERSADLGIHGIKYKILVHPQRDPGCYLDGHNFLRVYATHAKHALVMLDHEGSGREEVNPNSLTRDLEKRLAANGWGERAFAIIIKPELESWIWGKNPEELHGPLGWRDRKTGIMEWLKRKNVWAKESNKPKRPKEALEEVLRKVGYKRSSSIYRKVAESVTLRGCKNPAFNKLKNKLRRWFPMRKTRKVSKR